MESFQNSWYRHHLWCPDCSGSFQIGPDSLSCPACGYLKASSFPVDLRPLKPMPYRLNLPAILKTRPEDLLENICTERPEITYSGPSTPRNSDELMSAIATYLISDQRILEIGCGSKDQALPVQYSGYQYVGFDYSNPLADFLGDAHRIPFKSGTFNCVLAYAVLEHLHNPFVAIHEIQRVLKPGGIFVGTVSQGEPFHDSYFHHTPWGIISLALSVHSLEIRRLWNSHDTLDSLAQMGRYPMIIKAMLRVIAKIHMRIPHLAPRKMRWSGKKRAIDTLYRAGGICFVMEKRDENR